MCAIASSPTNEVMTTSELRKTMDESFICECGNHINFAYFGQFVRCMKCYNEYKFITKKDISKNEHWMRRFNNEDNFYPENWEQIPTIPREWNSKCK